jgi:hypothetical protein
MQIDRIVADLKAVAALSEDDARCTVGDFEARLRRMEADSAARLAAVTIDPQQRTDRDHPPYPRHLRR